MNLRTWKFHPQQSEKSAILAKELGLSGEMAQILMNRGLENPQEARHFLSPSWERIPSPFLLADMDRAIERTARALRQHEKIVIFGDFDVDGITGTSLLYNALRDMGGNTAFYIPDRLSEGYGMSVEALRRLRAEGAQVVITADNGIAHLKEAEAARELGIDLIITDHHEPGSELPKAYAVVNPKRRDCRYPEDTIAGVGVAFQFLLALRNFLREKGYYGEIPEPNLKRYLDIVALGTIADVVPLVGVNRLLVKEGIEVMRQSQWPGIQALLSVSRISPEDLSSTRVAFSLAPKINASGRIGNARTAVELLTATSLRGALDLAAELYSLNLSRMKLQEETLQEAVAQVEGDLERESAIVVASERWHPGVVGIVAAKLVELYHKPTVVIALSEGMGRGSARTPQGYDIRAALADCSQHLEAFGGHAQAAGLTLCADRLLPFKKAFSSAIASRPKGAERVLMIDLSLPLSRLSHALVEELELLKPFGAGNAEPLFAAQRLKVLSSKIVGRGHLKLRLKGEEGDSSAGKAAAEGIAFGMGEQISHLGRELDVAYVPEINRWRGKTAIQLNIKDMKEAEK
ncbi:MAG: single-stranded-DNA-specific exonuclease RecJ [Deltaproteobacteria bacterium]|nr:single-stranded-DNA-specific exonuclease RecJ [Deltaproteobacteria bacterium]